MMNGREMFVLFLKNRCFNVFLLKLHGGIPKQIAEKIGLKKGEQIVWILYDDGHVEVQKES